MEVMKKAKPQDIVYHYVKNQIVGKSMFPGNRIIEDDIIRETGTSRTSIRPALLRLKYEGLVEMIPNRGAFVAKPSEEDLRQVYRVREVLELSLIHICQRTPWERQRWVPAAWHPGRRSKYRAAGPVPCSCTHTPPWAGQDTG